MFKQLIAVTALLALTNPAFAGHCPADVKVIDAALEAGTDLNEQQLAQVKDLRDEGEALHKSGNHGESTKTLHEAMEILGIEHK